MQFRDVANGVQYLHECTPTVVHGDLKPVGDVHSPLLLLTFDQSNVLIDSNGQAKLCDFGLLRLVYDEPTGMTTTASHSGTPRYLSYELVKDEFPKATAASDIHALACVGMEVRIQSAPPSSLLSFLSVYILMLAIRFCSSQSRASRIQDMHSNRPR